MRRGTDSMRTMMLLWVRALGLLSAIHAATPAASVTPDLMWSARPLSEATIQESNSWMPVRDTNLTMRLENEAEVVISYAIAVLASRGRAGAGLDYFSNQGTSLAGGQRDFLQLRLVVNGVPYRQSSSHCSPGFSLQTAADMLSGHAAVALGPGSHDVVLQWKKVGDGVSSWSNRPSMADGHTSARSIVVTARHRYLWHTHAESVARIEEEGSWIEVPGMSVDFELQTITSLRFLYSMTVRSDQLDTPQSKFAPLPPAGRNLLITALFFDSQAPAADVREIRSLPGS